MADAIKTGKSIDTLHRPARRALSSGIRC